MGNNEKITGLGDVVAIIAQPIAKAIDRVAGTNIRRCRACRRRRGKMNQLFPFNRKVLTPDQLSG